MKKHTEELVTEGATGPLDDDGAQYAPSRGEDASAPRYKAIYEALLEGIRSGVYPVGSLLPPELELCRLYDASRHTIREAVRMLTESGIVSRRAGVGTRVETTKATTRYTQQISKLSDLFEYIKNATLHLKLVRMVKVGKRASELLGCAPDSEWLRIVAIKLLASQSAPVAHSDVFVHPDYSAVRSDVGKVKLPLSMLIEQKFSQRIHEVKQEFSAVPIQGETAKALKLKPGTPGLVITRKYYGSRDTLMLVTVTTFPYKKMKYSMSLRFDWDKPS